MTNEKIEYEVGSGNVFKDLDIPNLSNSVIAIQIRGTTTHIPKS